MFVVLLVFLFFVFVVPADVWCLLLFSVVLLAGFCFLLSASLFLLLLFLLLAFCSLSLLLSACCFRPHAVCFFCLVFAFCFLLSASCFLLLCVLDREQHGCNKTITITTATIIMTLTKDSHYSKLYGIIVVTITSTGAIITSKFPVTNERTSRNNKRFPYYTTIIISITHRYF